MRNTPWRFNRDLKNAGLRHCSMCRHIMPLDKFYKDRRAGFQSACIECGKANRRELARHRGGTSAIKALLSSARSRAKAKGLSFELRTEDISIPEFCPVLGIPLVPARGSFGGTDNSPSIDRIKNERGYVPGNCIVVSWRANRIKSDASPEELNAVAKFYGALKE